jgi:diaminopimelate epimerase
MRVHFTKMQGAGNDFVVLDETRGRLGLSAAQYRFLADRHFGVGADQILSVRPAPSAGVDFEYVIHNADGGEVEHCGNGARCFVRFVRDKGLTDLNPVRVKVKNGEISLSLNEDGRVTVDMGAPVFDLARVPFDAAGQTPVPMGHFERWSLPLAGSDVAPVAVLSMGNPHAVLRVDDLAVAPVSELGAQIEPHRRFSRKVNAGFMQVMSRSQIALRVFERDVGETLACGTGACAAVVAGIRLGWLDGQVDVHTRGGLLTVQWGGDGASVILSGPAQTVFEGEIDL